MGPAPSHSAPTAAHTAAALRPAPSHIPHPPNLQLLQDVCLLPWHHAAVHVVFRNAEELRHMTCGPLVVSGHHYHSHPQFVLKVVQYLAGLGLDGVSACKCGTDLCFQSHKNHSLSLVEWKRAFTTWGGGGGEGKKLWWCSTTFSGKNQA